MLSLQTGGAGVGVGVGLVLAGGTCGIRQETSTRRYRESTVHGPVKQKKGKNRLHGRMTRNQKPDKLKG